MVVLAEFTPDGAGLYHHHCSRYGVAYVSEQPSAPGEEHVIPGCGCRPAEARVGL